MPIEFYAWAQLPVNWLAAALIFLGVVLILTDLLVTGSGLAGAAGAVAAAAGAMLASGGIAGWAWSPTALALGGLLSLIIACIVVVLAWQAQRRKVVSGAEHMIGLEGEITYTEPRRIYAEIDGERWRVVSHMPLQAGDRIRVQSLSGLTLRVERLPQDQEQA